VAYIGGSNSLQPAHQIDPPTTLHLSFYLDIKLSAQPPKRLFQSTKTHGVKTNKIINCRYTLYQALWWPDEAPTSLLKEW